MSIEQHATLIQFAAVAENGSWLVFGGLLNQTMKARGSTSAKTRSRKSQGIFFMQIVPIF